MAHVTLSFAQSWKAGKRVRSGLGLSRASAISKIYNPCKMETCQRC